MLKKLLAFVAMLYAAACFAAVDVNKATAAELDGIKGIGPGISTKILDERKKGNFKDWTDFVDRVKGVGEGNAAKFSAEGLTVNGDSFKGVAPAPSAKAAKTDAKAAKADAKAPAASASKDAAKAAKAEAKATTASADKDAAKQAKADAKAAKAAEKASKPKAGASK